MHAGTPKDAAAAVNFVKSSQEARCSFLDCNSHCASLYIEPDRLERLSTQCQHSPLETLTDQITFP